MCVERKDDDGKISVDEIITDGEPREFNAHHQF